MARYCEPSGNVQLFKGSVTVTREYEEGHREARIDIETGTCITNPNPLSNARECPRRGFRCETGIRVPVPNPTGFRERMRAAITSQQNLKRREAAFLLGATARFAPAKCRNALLLSSKSAKLSFSQEKLLTTHYHEPTHIPSMDMRERERFASQGAKRRGENTTHPLDQTS